MNKRFLFFFLLSGLVLINACQKEYSLENSNNPSEGTLQDDGTGDCLPKTVAGAYVVGTALAGATNYIEVQVDVTKVGSYTIYTDTVNGMHFRGSGVFSTLGLNTVRLQGIGTPFAANISNFLVTYGTSSCTIAVTVVSSLADFTLDGAPGGCMGAAPAGTYIKDTALTASNTVTISVNVTTAGAYNITTGPTASNGMIFSGSGILAIGNQTIILTGSGTPAAIGASNFSLTAGGTTCSFTITVVSAATPATYTIDCAIAPTINGNYTVGTALVPATNTIGIMVNVTTAGTYTITGIKNGMTFTASGTFTIGNGQAVTLAGSGSPTTQGANIVQLTGGTATCDVTVNVNPGVAVAQFTVNCGSPTTVNGTYTQNEPLVSANTVTLSVTVNTVGTYPAITTTTTQGMTFTSVAGTFTAPGAQTVTLVGSGTPLVSGTINIPVTAGTTPCDFVVLVVAPAALSDYFPRTTNSVWSYEFDDDATDSVLTKVIAPTHPALGNTYNIFMGNGGGGFDTSGFYRKSGNDYYHYVDLAAYFGGALDIVQRVEFIFIKDNLAINGTWTTPAFANTTNGGTPVSVRIKFTILQQNTSISIVSSTGTITYPNTIVIKEEYEADFGTGWFSLNNQTGYYKDYYSKNIGWILDEYFDINGNPDGKMEARRFIVY